MKKILVILNFILITAVSSFANNGMTTHFKTVINTETKTNIKRLIKTKTKKEIVSKKEESLVIAKELLKAFTICTSGYHRDGAGNVIGDWFFCDFGAGWVYRSTIY